jgi:hypothetical protein
MPSEWEKSTFYDSEKWRYTSIQTRHRISKFSLINDLLMFELQFFITANLGLFT